MPRYTIDETVERLSSAIGWLEGIGINTSRCRFSKYMKLLTMESTAEEGTDRLFNAILEINEVCDIHEGLSELSLGNAYYLKLKQYCTGQEEYLKEPKRKNSQSRDIGFELAVASQFARSGFQVDTSMHEVDVATTHEGLKWLLECKRPRFDHTVRGNVKDAYKQLQLRSTKMIEPHYGVVAISFTKILMQETLLGVNATHDVAEGTAVVLMDKVVERFARELRAIHTRPSYVIGLLLRLILPYWDTDNREKGTFTLYSSVSFHKDGTNENESFKDLTRAISKYDVPVLTYS